MESSENRHSTYSYQIAISIRICIFELSPDEKHTLLSDIIWHEVSKIRKSDFFYIWRAKSFLKCSNVNQRGINTVSDGETSIIKFSISCIFTYQIFLELWYKLYLCLPYFYPSWYPLNQPGDALVDTRKWTPCVLSILKELCKEL